MWISFSKSIPTIEFSGILKRNWTCMHENRIRVKIRPWHCSRRTAVLDFFRYELLCSFYESRSLAAIGAQGNWQDLFHPWLRLPVAPGIVVSTNVGRCWAPHLSYSWVYHSIMSVSLHNSPRPWKDWDRPKWNNASGCHRRWVSEFPYSPTLLHCFLFSHHHGWFKQFSLLDACFRSPCC